MSSPKTYPQPGEDGKLYLHPRELRINEVYNVRPFTNKHSDSEDRALELLASSIEEHGQLDDVIINPQYEIMIGHRRTKAIIIANDRRSKNCMSLLRVRCRIDSSGGDLRQKAIHSNLQRHNLSSTDLLYLILELRNQHPEWAGIDPVAGYLGISPSSVNNILKLSEAGIVLQNQVHNGQISISAALRIIRETNSAEGQARILDRAREAQLEITTDKAITQAGKQISRRKATRILTNLRKPVHIEAPAVRQAIRELRNGASSHHHKPNAKRERGELVEAFTDLLAHTQDPRHIHFSEYLVNVFAPGGGTLTELRRLWEIAAGDIPE